MGEWWEVYKALTETEEGQEFINHYFTEYDGVSVKNRIEELHNTYSDCFLAHGTGIGSMSRKSLALDMDAAERIGLALTNIVEAEGDVKEDHEVVPSSVLMGEPAIPEDEENCMSQIRESLAQSGVRTKLTERMSSGSRGTTSRKNTMDGARRTGFLLDDETDESNAPLPPLNSNIRSQGSVTGSVNPKSYQRQTSGTSFSSKNPKSFPRQQSSTFK